MSSLRSFIFLSILLISFPLSAFSEAEESDVGEDTTSSTQAIKHRETFEATTGLYLAQISKIDEKLRYLFVKPLKGGPRRTFYLDKQTIYRRDRKKADISEFKVGENVGIRYVTYKDVNLASGVFLIAGETVDVSDLKMPPGYKR